MLNWCLYFPFCVKSRHIVNLHAQQSLQSHFPTVLMFNVNITWSSWPVYARLDNCMNRCTGILNKVPCKQVSLKTKCISHHYFLDIVWGPGECSLLYLNLTELCIQTYRRWHIVLGFCCLYLHYWRDSFCLWCAFCIWTTRSVKVLLSCLPVAAHAYSHLLQTPLRMWISTCLYSHLLSVSAVEYENGELMKISVGK